MITRFLFPFLASDFADATQVFIPEQRRFGRVAMLPNTRIALGRHSDAVHFPVCAGLIELAFVIAAIATDLLNGAGSLIKVI